MAVVVRGIHRSYGSLKVLKGIDLRADDSSIYGLLGPSGCGKTTLLNIILGRLIPESGNTETPSDIPGSGVGYAPQELALYEDLSIFENLLFHGRLHGMERHDILLKSAELLELLDLPESTKQVKKLSGGQKRRVSLAIALLHRPPLLLLDEPTVGVDPELRQRIWQHLRQSADDGTTVIITTHYIDEASRADRVGLMRDGVLLAESSPEDLLAKFSTSSLENVFLQLCKRGEEE